MKLSLQAYTAQTSEAQLPPFPSNSFPPVLCNIIETLHEETQIPKELIGNVVLAAASIACQSLINVESPYTKMPEQCCLYLMTIAESGEGKTTINKQIMKPFYDFSSIMTKDHEEKLTLYNQSYDIWKVKKQGLDTNLRQAIRKGYSGGIEEEAIKKLVLSKLKKPRRPNFIYEDVTPKSLMEGLSEQPEACIISDEAIIFFKGLLKSNPGLLNKSWDGESYDLVRARGEKYTAKPCLTISLMSQPGIFTDYILKHSATARESGFLSRFLFSWVNSSLGERNSELAKNKWEDDLKLLHTRINELLSEVKFHIESNDKEKKTLTLNDEAISVWKEKCIEIENKMKSDGEWEHIRDIGAKSGANTLRIAAILQYFFSSESNVIRKDTMEFSCDIMNWYMMQASNIFYPFSERYQFEIDVRELHLWIKDRFEKNNWCAFPKNEIEKYGPSRLRRLDKLTPVLNQLINQRFIGVIQTLPNRSLYISALFPDGNYSLPTNYHIITQVNIVQSYLNTNAKTPPVDLSRI